MRSRKPLVRAPIASTHLGKFEPWILLHIPPHGDQGFQPNVIADFSAM